MKHIEIKTRQMIQLIFFKQQTLNGARLCVGMYMKMNDAIEFNIYIAITVDPDIESNHKKYNKKN